MHSFIPSVSQQLIWVDQALSPRSAKYIIGGYAALNGPLSYPHFHETLRQVLASQEAYSSVFYEEGDEVRFYLQPANDLYRSDVIDFSGEPDPESAALRWMEADFARPFDVRGHHLFRFHLLRVSPERHFWYACIHHLIGDGWSFMLLLNQAAVFYTALVQGKDFPPEKFTYTSFIAEEQDYYRSDTVLDDREFWLNQFSSLPALPFVATASANETAGSHTLSISRTMRQQLQLAAEGEKVSLFQLIMGALTTYFCRICATNRLVIATPVLNRNKKQFRNTAGVFMNLLAIPFDVQRDDQFTDLVQQVRQKMSASLRHQRYPYGQLVKEISLPPGQHHLYGIRVSYESFEFTSDFGGLEATAVALSNHAETDPLAIYIREYHGEGFDVRFIYNTAYFTPGQVQSVASGLHAMLAQLTGGITIPIQQLPVMAPEDEAAIKAFAMGDRRAIAQPSFAALWQSSVSRNPAHIAVSTSSALFSYQEMNGRVNGIVHALLAIAGTKPVALVLPRSEVFIMSVLACITAGITYIPIDTSLPEERLRFILADTGAGCVLTTRSVKLPELNDDTKILHVDESEPAAGLPAVRAIAHTDDCYILYTSGSTGRPKGIVISQGAVADYALSFADYFRVTSTDVVLQQASFGFDTSVEEIFPILARGGRLHIAEDNKDMAALHTLLFEQGITILSTNPWVIRFLNGQPMPSSLRILINGGDVLVPGYINNINGVEKYNTYGPTEATVCATYYRLNGDEEIIPIGKPITNREVYILDDLQQLQPFDTEGEICIGGTGLALRYVNNEPLTIEKFIDHPFQPGARLYRTGDRGMLRRDGQLLFRGRQDQQLSFRGYRIEADEVEGAINRLPSIENSVVDVRLRNGEPVLTAYVKTRNGLLNIPACKAELKKSLPLFMVPGAWVTVDHFPLLTSGKIDRTALPEPVLSSAGDGVRLSGTQGVLQDLWQEILHVQPGPDDSFFELGGHSLNIVQLLAAIHNRFPVTLALHELYENDTIPAQAQLIDNATFAIKEEVPDEDDGEPFELTPAQKRLWMLSQLEDASKAYHIAGGLRLSGPVDVRVVEKTVNLLMQRHASLRTVFIEQEAGRVLQQVVPVTENPFYLLPGGLTDEWVTELVTQPFDLAAGPLFRVGLAATGPDEHVLVYVFHHLVADGWSVELLLREFLEIYTAGGMAATNHRNTISYKNYINNIDHNKIPSARAFWMKRLAGPLPVVELPTQFPRPAFKTYSGREVRHLLSTTHLNALESFCRERSTSVFVGLLATLNALLLRYTGLHDTIVGVPVVNRPSAESQRLVGLLLDTVPVRTTFSSEDSFDMLLQVQKKEVMDAFRHGHHPLDETLAALSHRNDPSRSPLFDILMVLHNQARLSGNNDFRTAIPGLGLAEYEVPRRASQFDMSFAFYYRPSGLELRLEYNDQLFEEWFVQQLAAHFAGLSWQLLQQPDAPLHSLDYTTSGEQTGWKLGGPQVQLSTKHLLVQLKQRAGAAPGDAAVVCAQRSLSYAALVAGAEQVGAYLRSVHDIQAGDRVAVVAQPSEWLPAVIYGIWQAGAVYVPVHPANPELRRQLILDDAGCKAIITEETITAIKAFQPAGNCEDRYFDGAYILYTSGTTGRPKGVLVGHSGLSAKLDAELSYLPPTAITSCLLTNYGFDVSFLELFLPLLTGGTVVIPEAGQLFDPEALARLLVAEKINVVHGTPTFIESFFRQQPAPALDKLNQTIHTICMGGESLYAGLVEWLRRELPDVQLNNHYGPTEAIIHATVKEDVHSFAKNSIGSPMPGTYCRLLDAHLQPVPKGVTGNLYVGGDHALAECYINQPQETERKFIHDPFSPGKKLYHTGDLARLTASNEIEFLGRSDDQIKIRGFRVELDEIQRLLEGCTGVTQAVVCPYQSGPHQQLIAFLVCGEIPSNVLRPYLQSHLPDYMIPAQFINVKRIPLNSNGKVDRAALLAQANLEAAQTEFVSPRTPLEKELCALWEDVLERQPVGIQDNFFDLGGNSILLIALRTRLKRTKGLKLELRELLRLLTVEKMAEAIESLKWMQEAPAVKPKNVQEFYI